MLLGNLKLFCSFIQLDLMRFFKVCNGFVNMDISDSYRFKEVYRGHNRTLHVNYARTDKRKYYWLNRNVTHCNGLDGAIVNAGNPLVFKRLVRNVGFISRKNMYCV